MIDTHDYLVHLVGTGEKTGVFVDPDDDPPRLEVGSPPEFGGPGRRWSPEHLFVAAVSGCLMTTFRAIAAMSRVEVLDYEDRATGRLSRDPDGRYRMTAVTLRPRVVLADESTAERARRLLDKAERSCLISRSISADITVEPTIETLQLV